MYRTWISLRYLRSRKVALISLASVSVGVAAMIVVTSVMDGFQTRIREHIRSVNSSLTIVHQGFPRDQFERVSAELRGEMADRGGLVTALSPRQQTQGLIGVEGWRARLRGVNILGIDWALERNVVPLDRVLDAVKDPAWRVPDERRDDPLLVSEFDNKPKLLMGLRLAQYLRVSRGQRVTLITGFVDRAGRAPGGESRGPAGEIRTSSLEFEIAGCFESGKDDFDSFYVYIDREECRGLARAVADATSVHAALAADVPVAEAKARLMSRHPDLLVTSWEDEQSTLLAAIKVEKRIMLIILFFIILVAATSILGILHMMVVEKTRDIGILLAMGATTGGILRIFVNYGLAIGLVGCGTGVFLGLEVVWNLNAITDWLSRVFGIEIFSQEIYSFKEIPTRLDAADVALITGATLAVAVAASLIPAYKAARLRPVECLRYE